MKKGKATALLSIVSVFIAILLVMTFLRFPIGIKNFNSILGTVKFDYDLAGGTAYTLTLAKDNEKEVSDINEVIGTISERLNALGETNYNIKAIKSVEEGVTDYDLRIESKSSTALAENISTAAAYGSVVFYGDTSENPTTKILTKQKAVASANYVGVQSDGTYNYYQIEIAFTDYAYNVLLDAYNAASESDSSYYLKIMLGEEEIFAAKELTEVNKKIYIQLTSQYGATEAAAKQMALKISTGGLAYKYDISEAEEFTATLGEKTLDCVLYAVGGLVVIMMLALIIAYKGFGLLAAVSMLVSALLQISMLVAVPGITVSLTGVIGFVCASLLAFNFMLVMIKRVREEYLSGKTVKAAINKGYRRSLLLIINSSVISAIFSIVLFALFGGAIGGFAITFGIGTAVALVSSLLIFKMFISFGLAIANKKEAFFNLKREDA